MWGLSQVIQALVQLLSGILIPITFFPRWAQQLISFFPFSSMSYTPTMIYLGKINGMEIIKALGLQVFWILILLSIARLMWKTLIKNLTILVG